MRSDQGEKTGDAIDMMRNGKKGGHNESDLSRTRVEDGQSDTISRMVSAKPQQGDDKPACRNPNEAQDTLETITAAKSFTSLSQDCASKGTHVGEKDSVALHGQGLICRHSSAAIAAPPSEPPTATASRKVEDITSTNCVDTKLLERPKPKEIQDPRTSQSLGKKSLPVPSSHANMPLSGPWERLQEQVINKVDVVGPHSPNIPHLRRSCHEGEGHGADEEDTIQDHYEYLCVAEGPLQGKTPSTSGKKELQGMSKTPQNSAGIPLQTLHLPQGSQHLAHTSNSIALEPQNYARQGTSDMQGGNPEGIGCNPPRAPGQKVVVAGAELKVAVTEFSKRALTTEAARKLAVATQMGWDSSKGFVGEHMTKAVETLVDPELKHRVFEATAGALATVTDRARDGYSRACGTWARTSVTLGKVLKYLALQRMPFLTDAEVDATRISETVAALVASAKSFDDFIEDQIRDDFGETLCSDGVTGLRVAQGSTYTVPFILQGGCSLCWEFRVKDHDLGFALRLRLQGIGGATEEDIFPMERYPAGESYLGTWKAANTSAVVMVWDNSYSRFRSKKLAYKAMVIQPGGTVPTHPPTKARLGCQQDLSSGTGDGCGTDQDCDIGRHGGGHSHHAPMEGVAVEYSEVYDTGLNHKDFSSIEKGVNGEKKEGMVEREEGAKGNPPNKGGDITMFDVPVGDSKGPEMSGPDLPENSQGVMPCLPSTTSNDASTVGKGKRSENVDDCGQGVEEEKKAGRPKDIDNVFKVGGDDGLGEGSRAAAGSRDVGTRLGELCVWQDSFGGLGDCNGDQVQVEQGDRRRTRSASPQTIEIEDFFANPWDGK